MIRVLLVDDHELIRQGLGKALEAEGDITVVGEAGTVSEGLAQARALEPDVVLMDVGLPDGNGLEAVAALRAAHPNLGIVVLTMYADDKHLLGALEREASAFVAKSAPADQVVAATRHAAIAPRSFSAEGLAGALGRRSSAPAGPQLSGREQEVLELLCEGLTVGAIARRLYVSESTAKGHVARLYEKLGVSSRSQAVLTAVRLGLVTQQASS